MITLYIQINIFCRNAKIANVAKKETLKFSVEEVDKLYERQRGRVVRAPDLKSGDPDHSEHWLDSFEVVRGSTPRRMLLIPETGNRKERTKQKERLEETIWVNVIFYQLCPQMASTF